VQNDTLRHDRWHASWSNAGGTHWPLTHVNVALVLAPAGTNVKFVHWMLHEVPWSLGTAAHAPATVLSAGSNVGAELHRASTRADIMYRLYASRPRWQSAHHTGMACPGSTAPACSCARPCTAPRWTAPSPGRCRRGSARQTVCRSSVAVSLSSTCRRSRPPPRPRRGCTCLLT
jgi:hypothetical protein